MQVKMFGSLWLSLLLFISSVFLPFSNAHNILLKAHSRECFNEVLRKGDKMAVTYQVGDREFGGSGNLAIDFWVSDILQSRNLPIFSFITILFQNSGQMANVTTL